MTLIWSFPAIFLSALLLTWALRRYALKNNLIDLPNGRSSHLVPTPRGGGGAIVFSFLVFLPLLFGVDVLSFDAFMALFGAGLLVAIVGFLDDHGHIAARWRLLCHFTAAGWALMWTQGLPPLEGFGFTVDLGWFGNILAAFYLVWLLNLYNFMDGIDGLASVEAITVCLGAALLHWLSAPSDVAWTPLLLCFSVAGFCYWNFPKAKIFMGDASSGFLGITLGILAIQDGWVSSDLFWGWLILLGVFIVDATFTLARRLLRGDKAYEAHRSHAYQFASRELKSHISVTIGVGLINVLWLLPIAYLVVSKQIDGAVALLIAYVPLALLAFRFNAGKVEARQE
ncbi:glycosyltransferase family 4 protein [Pseudomonas proteolytica]|uniref:MraY family glycosyltransferase n=1 Tax=Pseudomonas proteolytica TaxID=219574 RepID=UPI0014738984|nr:glycosyltransferase family 4 protein [Pseudomonas proteolytica]NMZ11765.1 glycosyltransferase family 4 protein [Pseudomonas proteolytica]